VRWYNDANLTGGAAIGANTEDPADGTNHIVLQTYQEANPFINSTSLYVGQDGMWDFNLIVPNGTLPGKDFCVRVVENDGTALGNYNKYAELQFGPTMSQMMRTAGWFDRNGERQPYFTGN
jgi:hypothetical protein